MKSASASAALLVIAACAHTTSIETSVKAPPEAVFGATVKAVVVSGFQLTHTDKDVGVIAAERPLKQAITGREGGGAVRLTVLVRQSSDGSALEIVWTPPGRALGSFDREQAVLIRHLRAELPGVEIK